MLLLELSTTITPTTDYAILFVSDKLDHIIRPPLLFSFPAIGCVAVIIKRARWIGACNEEKVKELLKIPDKRRVVALITFGYPAEQPKPRKKKPVEESSSFNSF